MHAEGRFGRCLRRDERVSLSIRGPAVVTMVESPPQRMTLSPHLKDPAPGLPYRGIPATPCSLNMVGNAHVVYVDVALPTIESKDVRLARLQARWYSLRAAI